MNTSYWDLMTVIFGCSGAGKLRGNSTGSLVQTERRCLLRDVLLILTPIRTLSRGRNLVITSSSTVEYGKKTKENNILKAKPKKSRKKGENVMIRNQEIVIACHI